MSTANPPNITVRAKQVVDIISIKGNTARLRFASRVWDVTIIDACHAVSLNQRIASILQTHFQSLFDAKVFSQEDKLLVIEGNHQRSTHENINFHRILTSQNLTSQPQPVDPSLTGQAASILDTLSQEISGPELFETPPPLETSEYFEKETDHLIETFAHRAKEPIVHPFQKIQERFSLSDDQGKKMIYQHIANVDRTERSWLFWTKTIPGSGYEREPKFSWIYEEVKFIIGKNSHAFDGLEAECQLQHVDVASLMSKDKDTLSDQEKRSVAVVYAKYLETSADVFDAGIHFYRIACQILGRDLVLLREDSQHTLSIAPQSTRKEHDTIDGKNTLFLFVDDVGGSINLYESSPAPSLDSVNSIGKTKEKIELHRDLNDKKQSALRSLAIQYLAIHPSTDSIEETMRALKDRLPSDNEDLDMIKTGDDIDFDENAFRALSEHVQIAVLEDCDDPNATELFVLRRENFYSQEEELDPSRCLLIWRSKKTRLYRSMSRDLELLTPLIKRES